MVQTRVCAYLQGACKHGSPKPVTFLHLPEHLRHQIYFYYAELPSRSLMHLRVIKDVPLFILADQVNELSPYANLRLVSRAVNADVPRCLSSRYPVLLCGPEITETFLAVLQGKPWDLLGYARSLTIVLNGFTYYSSPYCSLYNHGNNTSKFSTECKATGMWTMSHVSNFLPLWEAMITRLTQSSHVANLELNLICDVEDSQAAHSMLNLLRPPLTISKCTIRLHPKPSAPLEEVARQAVLRVTGKQADNQIPFRFLDLPTELRHRILEFTDLVAPFREVQWDIRCVYHLQDRYRRSVEPCSCGDFCRNQSATYPTCFCFRSPCPLFLVCRAMLQDARTVFYRSNRIVIVSPLTDRFTPSDTAPAPCGAPLLFNRLDASGLVHLRELEILLPCYKYEQMGVDIAQVVRDDWVRVLQQVKSLSLSLYLEYETSPDPTRYSTRDLRASLSQLFRMHEEIVRPLQDLKNLDTFFVHATSPYDMDDLQGKARAQAVTQLRRDLRNHEKKLEAVVMGDVYNSIAKGKLRRRSSRWVIEMYVYA